MEYLRIRNWERFQHYKNRRPPWVKFYVELLDNYELESQDCATRLCADRLLLLAARTSNSFPADGSLVGRSITMRPADVNRALRTLLSIGFLELDPAKCASTMLDQRQRHIDQRHKDPDQSYPHLVKNLVEKSLTGTA